jgi:hypothetical protein
VDTNESMTFDVDRKWEFAIHRRNGRSLSRSPRAIRGRGDHRNVGPTGKSPLIGRKLVNVRVLVKLDDVIRPQLRNEASPLLLA